MIAYLTTADRQRVLEEFARLPDAKGGRGGVGVVDAGMREVVAQMNAISSSIVVISSCTGHGPPEIRKGTVPGHLSFWLAESCSMPDTYLAPLVGLNRLSGVSRELLKHNDSVRPVLTFRWRFHSFAKSVRDIELALSRWFQA